jgi:hypothetical protein
MVQPWVSNQASVWTITYRDPQVSGTGWGTWVMAGDLDTDFPLSAYERPAVIFLRAVDPGTNGM